MIEFTVPGIPVPQGSKQPYGGESNPQTKPWRETVARVARDEIEQPLTGPVCITVRFIFPRPKAHYRTGRHADELRPNAPTWHSGKPDLDKLLRAIGDALTGVIVRDDAQIAGWLATKSYGPRPCAEISINSVAETAPETGRRRLELVTT